MFAQLRQGIFPKIPTAEEIARLIRDGLSSQLREMWYAGASSGLFAGLCVGLLILVGVLVWRGRS